MFFKIVMIAVAVFTAGLMMVVLRDVGSNFERFSRPKRRRRGKN